MDLSSSAYWLQIITILGPTLLMCGAIFEKVRQIEKRLDGNGQSIPGTCKVHTAQISELDRRITAVEEK